MCKMMAFMAILMGLGLLFYILLGFRYLGQPTYFGETFDRCHCGGFPAASLQDLPAGKLIAASTECALLVLGSSNPTFGAPVQDLSPGALIPTILPGVTILQMLHHSMPEGYEFAPARCVLRSLLDDALVALSKLQRQVCPVRRL